MKNIVLFFLLFSTFSLVLAQNRIFSNDRYINSIQDTVQIVEPDKYYLLKVSSPTKVPLPIIKRLDNDFAIIKGSSLNGDTHNQQLLLLDDTWKLSSRLIKSNKQGLTAQLFSIKYEKGANLAFIKNHKQNKIIRIIENANILILESTTEWVTHQLVYNSAIEFVDLANQVPFVESPIRQYNPDINRINTAKHYNPDLKGNNLAISIKENSINNEDIDLAGRITLDANSSTEFTQHAKEMGTLIAGAGNTFKTGEGVVSQANLICTDFTSLFAEDLAYYNAHNISVQNHSYGTGIENFYGNETVSYDQIAIDKPELVHVFSAGNAGTTAPEFGTYAGIEGYANLTGDYKQAKNVLVIAALDSTLNHVTATSSGPAYDGRLKPELAAFGGEGTSESAAIASGAVAMLQNHYLNINGSLPPNSLVKSLLIAGANEAHTPGIDYRTGYGSINLNRSIQLLDSGWYQLGTLNSNDQNSFVINAPANAAELKVVVSWTDPPANPEDINALVNDLELTVTAPDNSVWLPWVLNPSANANTLANAATRGQDHLNNTEMISLENPSSGAYTIAVNSDVLQGTTQSFSISYAIKKQAHFEWSYPTGSDHLEANTQPFLRWENTYPSQNGSLSIKYGSGNWEPIGTVNVTDQQFKYELSSTTNFAILKMDISGEVYLSDTFTISKPLELDVENDCADNFTLSWNKLQNTSTYTLYQLQSNEMVPVLSTNDTLINLEKSVYSGRFFAVRPTLNSSIHGLRSYSIDLENKNKGCYITNFLAFLDTDGFANIQLSINVPHEVEEVTILKEFQEKESVFQQFTPGFSTDFFFEDYELLPGKYTYSTQLSLYNSEKIFSDSLSLFYTDETVIAFPNPVQTNVINILNNHSGGILQLIDSQGNVIKNYDLVNIVEPIDLTGLNKGVYLYRVVQNDHIVSEGRFVRL